MQKATMREFRKSRNYPADFATLKASRMPSIFTAVSSTCLQMSRFAPHESRKRQLWHLHGDVGKSETILMGIRKYGLQITELEDARKEYKKLERNGNLNGKLASALEKTAMRKHAVEVQKKAKTWLDVGMASPLLYLGVGMSTDEWIQWWFLTQRARNFAGVPENVRPPVWILIKKLHPCDEEYSKQKQELETLRHLGVKPLYCESWEKGWEDVLENFQLDVN